MRILVTGGTGYLGRAVVRALHRAGHDVLVYGRSATAAAADFPSGITAVDGDIRDGMRLTQAAGGCRAIVHTAALVAVWRRDPREFDAVNVGGLSHVLDAARACGVERVVYTSSFLAIAPRHVDPAPAWNDYQRTKAAADLVADAAVAAGAPLIRLYPGVIYGPGIMSDGNLVGRMMADHLAGRLPGIIGAERIWSFAYVDDVAAAHAAAIERGRPGQRYLLGGDDAPQMRPFEIVRALTGRPLPRRLPDWLAAATAAAEELRVSWFGGTPLLTTGTLEILLRDWPLGSGLAQQELDYRITPLEDGIRAVVDELAPMGAPSGDGRRAAGNNVR